MEVRLYPNSRRPGVGLKPRRESQRPLLPQHARHCPVLEAGSALGLLVYPPLEPHESFHIEFQGDGKYQFAYFLSTPDRKWQGLFTLALSLPLGSIGMMKEDVEFLVPNPPISRDEALRVARTFIVPEDLGTPPGALSLRGATNFQTPAGWDAALQPMLEKLRKSLATMKANGITMDLAPVLDLDDRPGPSDTNPDGTRSFSKREAVAEAAGISFAQGLLDAGVVPVVKHFPGLGGATGNTDTMAASTLPWSTLQKDGLLPFAAAIKAGVPAVMVANARVPGLTNLPASLAPEVITTVLRGQLGFKGLVVTDSLSATAVSAAGYSVPQAAAASLAAGADLILFTSNSVATTTDQIVRTIVAAVGSGKLPRSRHRKTCGRPRACSPSFTTAGR